MDRLIEGLELETVAGQTRKELEGEIGRPHPVLEIEESVILRHPVPPPRHEGSELVVVHADITNLVVARVVQPCVLHLPDGLQDETRLEPRVERWILKIHVPLIEEGLRLEAGMRLEQVRGVCDGLAHPGRIAAVDMPGDEVQGGLAVVAGAQKRREDWRPKTGQ